MESIPLLRLLQLADSAAPIGAAAHSFGLESLVAEGWLTVDRLPAFLQDWLSEAGELEAAYCREAHADYTNELNAELSAWKTARESREASLTLGRRFVALASALLETTLPCAGESHLCIGFGAVGRAIELDAKTTASAYLHQSTAGLISVCQRLLPLGQSKASEILWDLKPAIVKASMARVKGVSSFTPMVDVASMRHPGLRTRLFIS